MEGNQTALATPVALMVFNRPFQTRRVLERIATARPKRLLVVADGAREGRAGEKERCEEVRQIVRSVHWPCEVRTNFADRNLGCRRRIVTGLDWVFEQVEEAIILEDDVLPDPSFFPFCAEMLSRYREDERIGMITGFNIGADAAQSSHSYYFSQLTHIWGWASWRRAWRNYDEEMACWPELRGSAAFRDVFQDPSVRRYWRYVLDEVYRGEGPNTWDYQWMLTNIREQRLSIVPRVNLIENIGFGAGATHVTEETDAPRVSVGPIPFPLDHPSGLIPAREMDALDQQLSGWCRPTLPIRAQRKLTRLLRAHLGRAA